MNSLKQLTKAAESLARFLCDGGADKSCGDDAALALSVVHQFFQGLIQEFNSHPAVGDLQISITEPKSSPLPASDSSKKARRMVFRFWIYSSVWALTVRTCREHLEVFLQPSSSLLQLEEQEQASALKLKLGFKIESSQVTWYLDGHVVNESEVNTLLRSLFKDMLVRSGADLSLPPDALRLPIGDGGESLSRSVRALVDEKFTLSQKVVSQQEEIQGRVARELHDAVISDIMILKRALKGDNRLSDEQVIEILDRITDQIYDICEDLTPRDLQDWGLPTVVSSLIERMAQRMPVKCSLVCPEELPRLPEEVELNIYRIIQESLNNIEKYSAATNVTVSLSVAGETMRISIEDDGQGFSAPSSAPAGTRGGRGSHIMRERSALIRLYYPNRLMVNSNQLTGTKVILELQIEPREAPSS
ncbi:MAG: hypothetical protein SFV17_07015 [Candidatus Obscuribacter sp.]|nr:hypothetical protein [Candidatus Obscuribacter sp.]